MPHIECGAGDAMHVIEEYVKPQYIYIYIKVGKHASHSATGIPKTTMHGRQVCSASAIHGLSITDEMFAALNTVGR